jgi:diphthamide synthase subunit DPH2
MNIIFLDIDGVLNSELYYSSNRYKEIEDFTNRIEEQAEDVDPLAVSFLNELINKTNAKIVISSTWRNNNTIEQLQEILRQRGFTGEIIGLTPRLLNKDDCILRGNEILCWIKNNKQLLGQEYYNFKSYVIFDDDSDMLYWQKDNFILCDGYVGLTNRNCYRAQRNIFNIC